ncbi:hypothetical protein ACT3CD_12095 [Geofilum sp. OHC36d9]|uniref:hypothetical protein n=1 Tax=Geofilum sp. OHC36d9 TaxID=3458413 RepID=UPI004034B158
MAIFFSAPGEHGSARGPYDSAQVPRGSAQVPDGSAQVPRGSAQVPDDSAQVPRGSARVPRGSARVPDGSAQVPRGSAQVPHGSAQVPRGSAQMPDDSARVPHGWDFIFTFKDGNLPSIHQEMELLPCSRGWANKRCVFFIHIKNTNTAIGMICQHLQHWFLLIKNNIIQFVCNKLLLVQQLEIYG